jgi:microcystin-dependent protein
MGALTPIYKLPYPVGSDRVRDGDNAIQALAERVELVLSPALVPTGVVLPFAGSIAPTGYLMAQGQLVDRVAYAALFGVIGTTYGAGDGSTTFALPDLRSRVPLGAGQGAGLRDRPIGSAGGREDATLPSHAHGASAGGMSAQHVHSVSMSDAGGLAGGGSLVRKGGVPGENTGGASSDHSHAVTVNASGADPADANTAPYVAVNYLIRT